MTAAPLFRVVETGQLPEYPIPAGVRLESHGWFAFHHAWWRNSRFRMMAERDVRGVFWDLIAVAQDEDPVGTLPVDDEVLARLAAMTLDEWRRFAGRKVPPLYGWQRCVCSTGEVKLFHPKLLEVTLQSVRFKAASEAKKAADRERKRLDALPDKIVRAGGHSSLAKDEAYVLRLDQWLVEAIGEGSRTVKVVRAAMEAMEIAVIEAAPV